MKPKRITKDALIEYLMTKISNEMYLDLIFQVIGADYIAEILGSNLRSMPIKKLEQLYNEYKN